MIVEVDVVYRFTTDSKKFMTSPLSTLASSYGVKVYFICFACFNLLPLPKVII